MFTFTNNPLTTTLEFTSALQAATFIAVNGNGCISECVMRNNQSGKFEVVIKKSLAEKLGIR